MNVATASDLVGSCTRIQTTHPVVGTSTTLVLTSRVTSSVDWLMSWHGARCFVRCLCWPVVRRLIGALKTPGGLLPWQLNMNWGRNCGYRLTISCYYTPGGYLWEKSHHMLWTCEIYFLFLENIFIQGVIHDWALVFCRALITRLFVWCRMHTR